MTEQGELFKMEIPPEDIILMIRNSDQKRTLLIDLPIKWAYLLKAIAQSEGETIEQLIKEVFFDYCNDNEGANKTMNAFFNEIKVRRMKIDVDSGLFK